jgi:tetrapyrrole methylase family protein/MazG family protein/ATP diphosphatase
LTRYLLEESAEYIDAVDSGDRDAMRDELGDVLLQVVFHAQIASEEGAFTLQDVIDGISEKLWFRHPHVFGDVDAAESAQDVDAIWQQQKDRERARKGQTQPKKLLDAPTALEPMLQALKISKQGARGGFDFPDHTYVFDKIDEEVLELREAIAEQDPQHVEEEVGDLLFACVNLARKLGVDPHRALRGTTRRFEQRFSTMLQQLGGDIERLQEMSLEDKEAAWMEAKRALGQADD